jgi:hypothetical protein
MTVHKMADGCCSAVTPCAWQRTNPATICDTFSAASPSVSEWLAEQEAICWRLASEAESEKQNAWNRAQAAAFSAAHAYAVARPDRMALSRSPETAMHVLTSDADLAYLAGVAISSKDATLARIAAALLLAR